jgi:hypothetical protein
MWRLRPLISAQRLRCRSFLRQTPWATAFRGFHRLTVNHSGRRARLSAGRLARRHYEGLVERGKDSAARPGVEIALHRRVGWEVLGQLPPLAAGGGNVENCIYHRSHVCRTWTPERRSRRQKRLHHKPLSISRIASYRKPSRL